MKKDLIYLIFGIALVVVMFYVHSDTIDQLKGLESQKKILINQIDSIEAKRGKEIEKRIALEHEVELRSDSIKASKKRQKQIISQYEDYINGHIISANAIQTAGTAQTLSDSIIRAGYASDHTY